MGPVNFTFALVHHPGNWFTAYEDPTAMRRLRQEFAIVLHGHEHQEWIEINSDNRLLLSAGACYESSWMANGYSFGYIDLDQQKGGIQLRHWDSVGRGWVPHNIAGKTNDGLWPLQRLSWISSSDSEKTDSSTASVFSVDDPQAALGESAEEHYSQRYCKHVIDQHDVLELFGCDIPRELQRHQLSVAYVSLNLAPEDAGEPLNHVPRSHVLSKKQTKSKVDEEPQENIGDSSAGIEHILDNVSEGTGRLLINGPAGAGKSTLMRWCVIHAAKQLLDESSRHAPIFEIPSKSKSISAQNQTKKEDTPKVPGTWRQKIPFLIRLRDCPAGRLPAANELPGFLAKHLPSAPSNWMTSVLDSGQALVLFDGVDEIHRDQRPQLAEEIDELIRTYPACNYVVTTRPGAVEPGWLARLGFTEARVEPMGRRDREEFIDKWYRSAALELKQRPRAGEDLTRTAFRLKVELAEQPELGLLASNPLLCAMICALYRERQEKLPETPAELSEALCHMLLHRRERETPGLADKHFQSTWRALQYSQKKGLLAELAWHMVSQGDSSIDHIDAKQLVAEGLASTPGRKRDEASEVVQSLVERSGLLRPASDDRIDFLHNSLKEYLAAGRVVETGDWKVLAEHTDDPAWQPIILFALALAPETFSSALVAQLLTQITLAKTPTTKSGSLKKSERKALATAKSRQFFLVRCRAAAKWLAADLSNTIDGFLKHLLPPGSMNEVDALAQLGPRILSHATATLENGGWWAKQTCSMATRCLRLLRMVGGPRAQASLKAIYRLPSLSSQLTSEWILACCELCPDERIPWPFKNEKQIILNSIRITDISLLEDLTSLQYLDLNYTRVASLKPLIGHTLLQYLRLSGTPVSDLRPLANLTSLKTLALNATKVSDLSPLIGMNLLEQLFCRFTEVHDLSPLVGLISLKNLYLNQSPIEDISPLKGMIALQTLSLSGTKVIDLSSLAKLGSLESLILDETPVEDLAPLKGIVSLQTLSLSGTKVIDLSPLAGLDSLKILDLYSVSVVDLTPLKGMAALQTLNLSGTKVTDLSPLAGLSSLQSIDLEYTKISDLRPLLGIASLQRLDLTNTDVEDFNDLTKLTSLQHLDLTGTKITNLKPLTGLISLEYLYLRSALINDLTPLAGLTSLKYLHLDQINITDLNPLSGIKSLKHLFLGKTAIDKQEFENFKTLRPDIHINTY